MPVKSRDLSRRRFLRGLTASALAAGVSIIDRDTWAYPDHIGIDDGRFSVSVLRPTLRGLEAMVHAGDSTGLPYDMVNAATLNPEDRAGSDDPYKSSGLEIALRLAGLVAQADLGMLTDAEALAQASKTLDTVSHDKATASLSFTDAAGQERTATFPYLWLDPRTGQATHTREIPAIDNGQLAYSLAVLTERFAGSDVAAQAQRLLDAMDFRLFERDDGLLALKHQDGRLHGKIDLWGSEGIITPFLSILKDEGAVESLPHPDSTVTYSRPEGPPIRAVPTFGGSLFTAIFPLLFWGTTHVPEPILENARRHVRIHWAEGQRLGLHLWGWAPAQDLQGAYDVYGVPEASVFADPSQAVIAAYASALALNLAGYEPAEAEIQAATANLFRLMWAHPVAFTDRRGFVDSARPNGQQVARNLLALDKGMETISLYNLTRRDAGKPGMDGYFWAYLERIGQAERGRQLLAQRADSINRLLEG